MHIHTHGGLERTGSQCVGMCAHVYTQLQFRLARCCALCIHFARAYGCRYDKDGGGVKYGFFPRNNSFYRKHFRLPSAWRAGAKGSIGASAKFRLRFEGIYKVATVWINGKYVAMYGDSSAAYTSFTIPLDADTSLNFEGDNVVAVHIDGSYGSEHWYAGAGIYRHVYLEKVPLLNIVDNGVYAPAYVTGTGSAYVTGTGSAFVAPTVTVANNGSAAVASYTVSCQLLDSTGKAVNAVSTTMAQLGPSKTAVMKLPILTVPAPALWSVKTPTLYQLVTTLTASPSADSKDVVETTVGIRRLAFGHADGLSVNGERVKIRGFCHHNDFTGVGMAVPERINLFRAQMMRGIGGNAWRMSHNPYRDTLYDTLDRLGVLVWDETRDLREAQLPAFAQMVREHRNHPSIMLWSFCNEGGCSAGSNQTLGAMFNHTAKEWDPSRLVSGNMRGAWGAGTLSDKIDVQGLSHPTGELMDQVHGNETTKAFIASECCSCMTMRGENHKNVSVERPAPSNFNGPCLSDQVNRSDDGRPWSVGSMVWTLFDYYGEPYGHAWPHVASSYGSFDVAGFPKAAAWWYRSLWLDGTSADDDAGRPPLLPGYTVRIVQDNQIANRQHLNNGTVVNTIQVYSSCPTVDLLINGKSLGKQSVARYMWAEYTFPFEAGNLTAVCFDSSGTAHAAHTVETAGQPVAIVLSVDVPAAATGTGSALVLDGQDVGMVRATIVDSQGRVVPFASNNITFSITNGPGRILGVGNGDPTNHEPNQAPWRSAFHGLARGLVQVTTDAASSLVHRRAMSEIDTDGNQRTLIQLSSSDNQVKPTQVDLRTYVCATPISYYSYSHLAIVYLSCPQCRACSICAQNVAMFFRALAVSWMNSSIPRWNWRLLWFQ